MSDSPLLCERRGGLALLTLNRPDAANSLSRAMVLELGRAGRELTADPTLRAIVLTGAGDRVFCAGADLKERRGMADDDVRRQLLLYRTELFWLRTAPVPVVAALNGAALGGGLELALLCDLRLAAEDAVLGLPEVTLGIIPAAGGTQTLSRLVGEARAKELILFGRRVSATEAERIGLVNRVTPRGKSVLEDALEWVAPLLEGAPIAQRAALRAIDAGLEVPFEQGGELERVAYDDCIRSNDRREALAAFAEKRKPRFTGA